MCVQLSGFLGGYHFSLSLLHPTQTHSNARPHDFQRALAFPESAHPGSLLPLCTLPEILQPCLIFARSFHFSHRRTAASAGGLHIVLLILALTTGVSPGFPSTPTQTILKDPTDSTHLIFFSFPSTPTTSSHVTFWSRNLHYRLKMAASSWRD